MKVKMVIICFLTLVLVQGCNSTISVKKWSGNWVGVEAKYLKSYYESLNKSYKEYDRELVEVKEYNQNTNFIRTHKDTRGGEGECFVDFIIDPETQVIVGYKFYGNIDICNTY